MRSWHDFKCIVGQQREVPFHPAPAPISLLWPMTGRGEWQDKEAYSAELKGVEERYRDRDRDRDTETQRGRRRRYLPSGERFDALIRLSSVSVMPPSPISARL